MYVARVTGRVNEEVQVAHVTRLPLKIAQFNITHW